MIPVVQAIDVYSQHGCVLQIRIEESNGSFRMSGDYAADGSNEFSVVAFSGDRVASCEERLEKALENLRDSLTKKGDQIIRIHNPCNTPFITAAQQSEIVRRLNVIVTVEVN